MALSRVRYVATALALLIAFAGQGTRTLAGTTGGLSGTVVDAGNGSPIAGAQVTLTSPSQTANGATDAGGRFTFLTLSPDTYTITIVKSGYQPLSIPGQTVFADSVQPVTAQLQRALQTIAHVAAVGAGSLVKSGTTADVYSVNAAGQRAASALGGGGSLNSAYAAIATVPGAYVIPNQTGYYQTVHIRGGDYDQVGYEFDGVPVNRSFDNYPSSSASALGNAEVQVYTGASPANSEGQGLAGFINQVIKTGTYPGYAEGSLGIGTPTFYHRAAIEIGGATPDRLFSYYVGIGGYNQDFRYVNDQNGANYDQLAGVPLVADKCGDPNFCPYAGGVFYPLGPTNYADLASVSSRDVIVNLHLAIPHRYDSGRDDVQLLWDSSALKDSFYTSTNDIASPSCTGSAADSGAACANATGLGQPIYLDGYQWNCQSAVGSTFSAGQLNAKGPGCTSTYFFPNSTNRTSPLQPIPVDARDGMLNDQEIEKLQYTKNFGSTAFLRVYGYLYYSDWFHDAPQSAYSNYVSCCAPDYELSSHTRGFAVNYQNQINAQNLLNAQASYVTASTVRDNNSQWVNFTTIRQYAAVAVNAADPYGGYCYGSGSSAPQSCSPGNATTTFANWAQLQAGKAPDLPATCVDPRVATTKCTYLLAENSLWATYNNIVPKFFSASLTDEFRPSDKLLFNLGVRLDSYTFQGGDTDTGPARQFWYNAYNLDNCVNNLSAPSGGVYPASGGPGAPFPNPGGPGAACPGGSHAANLVNTSAQSYTYNIYQPRIGGTYTLDPNNVIRFSYGRYAEPPNAAFEQYNTLEEDEPFGLLGPNLLQFGRTSPGLPIAPPTSLNYDVSYEHRFTGTDLSFKLTPFLRQTQDQIQQFYLNQQTGFVSGLNVGSQRSQGVEFQMQKGDFSHNGLSGLLSFAYTNSYIKYGLLNNGSSIISPINTVIADYNAYTRACASGGAFHGKSQYGQTLCGATTTGVPAAPCYTTSGAPVSVCTAGDVGNPYWNNPQALIDPGQNFTPYSIFPQGIGSSASGYGAPYVTTLILNYKRDKLALTPSFQFVAGSRYGAPLANVGIDPATCTGVLPVTGANGGGRYNAATCKQLAAIPDVYTGTFDNLGSFIQPSEFIMSMQLTYDLSPRVTLVGTAANIFNTCWGGTQAPWTYGDHNVCSYGINDSSGGIPPIGNVYNPAGYAQSVIQPLVKYPYSPGFGPYNDNSANVNSTSPKSPFNFYLSANIKL
jgi:Carboxypeptidase regulatory-like domain/TonB dependent receptor/TonB-dependent Receptor Plug Domain